MDLMLQVWGGLFYLLNKVFFALAAGRAESAKRRLQAIGWALYMTGVPAWVIILSEKHNWIAASIEAGGIPAMMYGLFNALKYPVTPNAKLDRLVTISTYLFLFVGISISVYEFGGIHTFFQLLEVVIVIAYLAGGYLLAKDNLYGWPMFMLMNISTALLMFFQSKWLLAGQQLISLCFVTYGFVMSLRSARSEYR